MPQIQIIFKNEAFQQVVPWLMLHRDGLDILVHPLSDNEFDDHTDYALWMGTPIELKVETLPHGPYPARLLRLGRAYTFADSGQRKASDAVPVAGHGGDVRRWKHQLRFSLR